MAEGRKFGMNVVLPREHEEYLHRVERITSCAKVKNACGGSSNSLHDYSDDVKGRRSRHTSWYLFLSKALLIFSTIGLIFLTLTHSARLTLHFTTTIL